MRQKIMLILLSGLICLMGITSVLAKEGVVITSSGTEIGSLPEKYSEAPMLETMVAAGEILPLEMRLPEEPLVVKPLESIGEYGGSLHLIQRGVDDWQTASGVSLEPLLGRVQEDCSKVIPNIAKDWELAPDAKSLIVYLREGLKWSDGAPFTADDILFWYEDILQNEKLMPFIPVVWKSDGELMQVEKIDEYTVKYKFALPTPGMIYVFSDRGDEGSQGGVSDAEGCFAPAHYLRQFHIRYNPDADKLAKKEGFDHWYELFLNKQRFGRFMMPNPDLPVLGAWMVKKVALDYVTFSRNPYFWKVDTEGNQLPYINTYKGVLAENAELRAGKILAGEPDFGAESVGIKKFPVVQLNAKKNNYRVWLNEGYIQNRGWVVTLFFNHTVEDPFLRELFSNVRFKQALSLAINRDEINEVALMSLGKTGQATLPLVSPFYEERFSKAYAEYDPEGAKKLLNEIGLKISEDGYRLRPDGKPLTLILQGAEWIPSHPIATELVADYWSKIGIKTIANINPGGIMWELFLANESQVSLWCWDDAYYPRIMKHRPWWATYFFWGRGWNVWAESGGKEGTEPPPEVKEFANIWEKIRHTMSEKERIRMGKQALELQAKNLWMIGVCSGPPVVMVARTSLKNVNTGKIVERLVPSMAFQWYWE